MSNRYLAMFLLISAASAMSGRLPRRPPEGPHHRGL